MLRSALALLIASAVTLAGQQPTADPAPQTLDEFRAAATRVLEETGVPGAGISLVRLDGVEWEGGLGFADRDRRVPVTAETHFRAGSISKTFVAIALMQMYYDDLLRLDADVLTIAPEVTIENPWQQSDPVQVIHLLQHTSGFDDMHFNEIYNTADPADIPLIDALKRNPNARRVRWRPGTRMSYSNPGYGVAGYLIEKLAGEPFEDYIERKILEPLGMQTSSFRLTSADEPLLAQGYRGTSGPPTGYPQIYLRPAGNLHSSPHEMGFFVRALLNWGELDGAFVIDPEYLSNMERSTTTLAAKAGVRSTYGSGIAWDLSLPFPVLGHGGGIEGFTSTYGYSPSRDAGYVILLNSGAPAAGRAIRRLSSLAIRYLKRDVDPPVKPEARVDASVLSTYEGYYQDANPRNQIMWPIQFFASGRTIVRDGDRLYMQPLIGERRHLVPTSDTTFRYEDDLDSTLVFTQDAENTMVLTGRIYAEKVPQWRVEIVRLPLVAALPILASPLLVAIAWVARLKRAQPRGFWELKAALILCPLAILAPAMALALTPFREWGAKNAATVVTLVATLAVPALVVTVAALAIAARREGASRLLVRYALTVACAAAALTAYLAAHGLVGLRLWAY